MPTFGDNLRRERESRNKAIEEIADATQIGQTYLEALERGEIDALPGLNFGKLYIRAYAEVLDFDPRPLIEAYEQELSKRCETEPVAQAPREQASGSEVKAVPLTKAQQQARDQARQEERLRARQERARARLADRETTTSEARGGSGVGESRPTEDTKALRERLARARRELNRARPMPATTEAAGEPAPEREEASEMEPASAEAPVTELPEEIRAAVDETPPVEPEVLPEDSKPQDAGSGRGVRRVAAVLFGAALLLGIAWVVIGWPRQSPPTLQVPPEVVVYRDAARPPTPEQEQETAVIPVEGGPAAPAATGESPVRKPPPVPVDLSVSEFGLGRRVVDRRLVDPTDRFSEGGVAWFATRVHGGVPGTRIHHVWLREGRRVQSIELRVGGSPWRTHSRKTLWGTGEWAVEARDTDGRVLARETFTCVKAGS